MYKILHTFGKVLRLSYLYMKPVFFKVGCDICFRSLVWLQSQRDASVERRGGLRRDDPHEYRVGRLKHERVTVPRGPDLLQWAQQVGYSGF